MTLVNLENITKTFKRKNEIIRPLDDISLSIDPGDFVVIMGRSGSGKSTLLNILALFLSPDEGSINFKGERINDFDDDKASLYRNRNIGYLMQNLQTISSLDVIENIILPNHMNQADEKIESRAEDLLDRLGILDLKNEDVEDLSGGEEKRVCLARSLINDPDLLILDEPTSNLDEKTAEDIMAMFKDLNKEGKAILTVTHDPSFLDLGTKNYELIGGKLKKLD